MSTDTEFQQITNKHYADFAKRIEETLDKLDSEDEVVVEAARQELDEMPLCIEKLITDHRNEEVTWEILLGTGGPAVRVSVFTDFEGNILSAEYQFQDWFKSWTTADNQNQALMKRFANQYYFEVTA